MFSANLRSREYVANAQMGHLPSRMLLRDMRSYRSSLADHRRFFGIAQDPAMENSTGRAS